MKNWVILFARTGSEEKLKGTLEKYLNSEEFLPFVPVKEMPYRRKGIVSELRKPLFPGYIFIQTGIEPDLVVDRLAVALKKIGGNERIYSVLHYGDDKKDVVVRKR
jgi:transcriptional antiterminator NusG